MGIVTVVGGEDELTALLVRHLERSPAVTACRRVVRSFHDTQETGEPAETGPGEPAEPGPAETGPGETGPGEKTGPGETVVYLAASRSLDDGPDREDAGAAFGRCRAAGVAAVVLVSSAEVHPPTYKHPGLVDESHVSGRASRHPEAGRWLELESLAESHLGGTDDPVLTVLRPAAVPLASAGDYFSRLLSARVAVTLPGHDPTLQLLSPDDLAGAVRHAVENPRDGVFHVAPAGVIPLRAALRLTGARRLPLPRWIQRLARGVTARLGLSEPIERLERIRYPWTVSGDRCRDELGWEPRHSSHETVRRMVPSETAPASPGSATASPSSRAGTTRDARASTAPDPRAVPAAGPGSTPSNPPNPDEPSFDDFGMDPAYIEAFRRTLFAFLHDSYWRVETRGLENLPRTGRAVLTGVHRGFMPWDGVMALHAIAGEHGRYPRFLIHPGLVKFPFLFNYMRKLGGIIACRDNADRMLQADRILGVFPEGIRGAFSHYRDAYELGRFGRGEYVRMALRNRAPILPFVTVGSAEIFPIFAKIDWRWWKRRTDWPCLPLTPTFPLLPLPLPSKWHTLFLEPLPVHERHPPEAADDEETVAAINRDVRSRMAASLEAMLERRRSIFFGSIFEEAA